MGRTRTLNTQKTLNKQNTQNTLSKQNTLNTQNTQEAPGQGAAENTAKKAWGLSRRVRRRVQLLVKLAGAGNTSWQARLFLCRHMDLDDAQQGTR